jgi:hypothetical protein
MLILDLRDLRISVKRLFKGVNCRANVPTGRGSCPGRALYPSVPRQILKDIPRPPNSASRDD